MEDTPFKVMVNDVRSFDVTAAEANALDIVAGQNGVEHILLNNVAYRAEVDSVDFAAKTFRIKINGNLYRVTISDRYDQLIHQMGLSRTSVQKINEIKAPMPGLVLEISVQPGDAIAKGDKVLILEAMKMENVLKSPGDGVVKTIRAVKGAAVVKGQVLIELQ